ncbi:UDP-glycosyltransferase UGT5-like [Diorhabda carinulata]|uniref:UDP-glycosyltransferase UGT5-like n=1 Tax=Diorhabda carinulata TaxID=1163345 RepID=UPI0025A29056|nr:UDP-glycosyltransferase UGT5-like [Diorhabda carinulata]
MFIDVRFLIRKLRVNMNVHLVVIFSLFIAVDFGRSLKILGVFPYCAHSHFSLGLRLMQELANRGHNVTFVSCYPQNKAMENFRDISVEEIRGPVDETRKALVDVGKMSTWGELNWISSVGELYTRGVLSSKGIQELWKSNEEFDVVILEHFVNDALAYFHKRFNCPLVTLAPGPMTMFTNHIAGNPILPAFVPNILGNYDSKMNFWERLDNTYKQVLGEIFVRSVHIPSQNNILKEFFPDAPDLSTFLYNSSIFLICSHISLSGVVPLQQNIKEIGGYHVPPPKPLPREYKIFMENATQGVILFSMGSNLKSANFEPEKRRAILKTFSKIKQKVIWKFESDLPEKPDNVLISSWLPQSDILAHPNTIGFISHGGLLGTTEAIYHGVPILGLPTFWDQRKNIEEASRKGYGLKLDFENLNEESFDAALDELINNPKYSTTAKERSRIMHDLPMKQIDEAVFWIEYVVRHNGAAHLKPAAVTLKWFELYLLDVLLFLVTISAIILYVIQTVVKLLFCKKKILEEKNKRD